MKYLTHYTQEAQTELFKRTGTFFAFGKEQFMNQVKPNTTYVELGNGMYCEKEHLDTLKSELPKIQTEGIERDLEENGVDAIIRRELFNHECFIQMDYSEVVENLKAYGITQEQVRLMYNHILETEGDDLF